MAAYVSPAPTLTEDLTLPAGHVSLVLGADFDQVSKPASGSTSSTPTTAVNPADATIGYVTGDPPPGVACPEP